MARKYTLTVNVTLETLQTLLDGEYKLVLGDDVKGTLTQRPDTKPGVPPQLPAEETPEAEKAEDEGVDIQATWESNASSNYKLNFALEEDGLFTNFNSVLDSTDPFVESAIDVLPGKAYELVQTDDGDDADDYTLQEAKGAAPAGAVGFQNSVKAQPILFKKEEGEEDGWKAVSRVHGVWVPGKGTLKIPDTIFAWFHSDDQDKTLEGFDAEDSSESVRLPFKYGNDIKISYNPEGVGSKKQWYGLEDVPQDTTSAAPPLKDESSKATSKVPRGKLVNRNKKIASRPVNGA